MKRRLAPAALLLAVGVAAAAPVGADVAALAAPPASVKLLECSRDARSATFHGRMKRIEGSERMWMRFTLLERRGARFEALEAPGLGGWHKSEPGVRAFGYRQTVRGLQAGASYRMRVDYRWYSDDGELLGGARRRSAACRQFERLPNLTASVVGAAKAKAEGVLRYAVQVKNTGVAASGGVAVRLAVDGAVLDTVTLGSLAPGEARLVRFLGPGCTASVSAAVDPDGVLVESSEHDNVQVVACADLPQR